MPRVQLEKFGRLLTLLTSSSSSSSPTRAGWARRPPPGRTASASSRPPSSSRRRSAARRRDAAARGRRRRGAGRAGQPRPRLRAAATRPSSHGCSRRARSTEECHRHVAAVARRGLRTRGRSRRADRARRAWTRPTARATRRCSAHASRGPPAAAGGFSKRAPSARRPTRRATRRSRSPGGPTSRSCAASSPARRGRARWAARTAGASRRSARPRRRAAWSRRGARRGRAPRSPDANGATPLAPRRSAARRRCSARSCARPPRPRRRRRRRRPPTARTRRRPRPRPRQAAAPTTTARAARGARPLGAAALWLAASGGRQECEVLVDAGACAAADAEDRARGRRRRGHPRTRRSWSRAAPLACRRIGGAPRPHRGARRCHARRGGRRGKRAAAAAVATVDPVRRVVRARTSTGTTTRTRTGRKTRRRGADATQIGSETTAKGLALAARRWSAVRLPRAGRSRGKTEPSAMIPTEQVAAIRYSPRPPLTSLEYVANAPKDQPTFTSSPRRREQHEDGEEAHEALVGLDRVRLHVREPRERDVVRDDEADGPHERPRAEPSRYTGRQSSQFHAASTSTG